MSGIQYREGYKYQLAADYTIEIPILPPHDISTRFIALTRKGVLTVHESYAWDGASGPTIDSKCCMRASLVHDALYQLIRDGHLSSLLHRPIADNIFHNILLDDGMLPERALLWYRGVAVFGMPSCDPASAKRILIAP